MLKFQIVSATAIVIAGIAFFVFTASAQSIGVGTTKAGANKAISAAIAKVVSDHSGLQMRPQAFGGGQQYFPIVDAGKLDFGVSNLMMLKMSLGGTSLFKGRKSKNLVLAATLMPFRFGFAVLDSSPIKTVEQLKGKRLGAGFNPQPLARILHEGVLANAGLSYKDVTAVPSSGWRDHWNQFMQGKLDGISLALGTAKGKEIEAKLGKLRYLSLNDSPSSVAAFRRHVPTAYMTAAATDSNTPGLVGPATVGAYDYSIWTGKHVSSDVVYKVVKAMYENSDQLKSASPHWKLFKKSHLAKKQKGVTYHPGAVKYFREQGLM
jgi:TRAP transporter TAXI family solute receptor